MSPGRYDLGDYVEVAERVIEFRQKFPDGSLASEVILWPTKELPFLAVKAYAHRSRKDEAPGVGHAWEPFPGKTPYTKDSELQNAETSAVGRAIIFALAADARRGIASADEVRARRGVPESTQARDSGDEDGPGRNPGPSSQSSGGDHRGGEPPEVEGTGGEPDGEGGKPPASFEVAVTAYGGGPRGRAALLRRARTQWDVRSVEDLTEPMLVELVKAKG